MIPDQSAQVDVAERALLQPDTAQPGFAESGQGQERVVLVVGRRVLGPDGQQQEWLHLITLVTWRACRSQPREARPPADPSGLTMDPLAGTLVP